MDNYKATIEACADYLKSRIITPPEIGLILGTGLGQLADQIENPQIFPYSELPHFPTSTVVGHKGQLVIGTLHGKAVAMLQGRFHYYEGYSLKEVVFPVYVLKALGVKTLIVTNACGGMNTAYQPGDIVLINDFINTAFTNPLIGPNDDDLGPRFPDMSEPYKKSLIELALSVDPNLPQGVYCWFSGPYYETAAEIRAFRILGGDLVGMSTVPETIAANHCGISVLAFAVVTNMATGIQTVKHDHHRVVQMANQAAIRLEKILVDLLPILP
jgi:purine-nucleoside phosphorylase